MIPYTAKLNLNQLQMVAWYGEIMAYVPFHHLVDLTVILSAISNVIDGFVAGH